jgi:hypothetical protein
MLQFRYPQGLQVGQLARGFHLLSSWLICLFRFGNHVLWILITLILSVAATMRVTQTVPPPPPPEQMQFYKFITVFILSCLYCCSSPIPQFNHVCISKWSLSGTYFYRRDPRPNMWNWYYFIKLSTLFLFFDVFWTTS